jgi:hypothetical protein
LTLRPGDVAPQRLAALGRTAQGVRLPPEQLDLLIAYAQRNPTAAAIDEIHAGLLHQRSLDIDPETDLRQAAERLRAHRRNSDHLALEINLAAVQLRSLAPRRREPLLAHLAAEWQAEFEPDIKAALAELIVETRRSLRPDDL